MGLTSVASIVLVCGVLATLVAGALWMRAWRGRVTGWRTCCGRCGFELHGLNPGASVCPECGQGLQSATLRPAAAESDPWRWALAVSTTLIGVALLWLGQPARLLQAGRQFCTWLPDPLLMTAFETMPRAAMPELEARVREGKLGPAEIAEAARRATNLATESPRDRVGQGGLLLSRLAELSLLEPDVAARTLEACLKGVDLVAGQPKPARPGGLFIVTVRLPALQGTQWIGRRMLSLTIESATERLPNGSTMPLERISDPSRAMRREFDGAAFRAPESPGSHEIVLGVRMEQPGGGFRSSASARLTLQVVDPSQIKVDLKPDPDAAKVVAAWAASASSAMDASGRMLLSIPGDIAPLQDLPESIAARALVEQDGLRLEAGRVWIDDTAPSIELQSVALPAVIDRTRPAVLCIEPDAAWALVKAPSSCSVLADVVRVPLKLPPPPAPPSTPASGAP